MKRSLINKFISKAQKHFKKHGWSLPPNAHWDVTDFGLDDFNQTGLVLVNLSEQPEYCEKLMYCLRNQWTPEHFHKKKKEDIISRYGKLLIKFPQTFTNRKVLKNNQEILIPEDGSLLLSSGERVTIEPGLPHSFTALTPYCVIGEVSTANDDTADNVFTDKRIGRFSKIEEDEQPLFQLANNSEKLK